MVKNLFKNAAVDTWNLLADNEFVDDFPFFPDQKIKQEMEKEGWFFDTEILPDQWGVQTIVKTPEGKDVYDENERSTKALLRQYKEAYERACEKAGVLTAKGWSQNRRGDLQNLVDHALNRANAMPETRNLLYVSKP